MKRTRFLLFSTTVLSLALFLTAWGFAQDVKGPRYGGTLVSVLPDDPPTLATWQSSSFLVYMVGTQIVEGLWTMSRTDAETIIGRIVGRFPGWFNMDLPPQKRSQMHDGKPFTADDVIFTVNDVWLKHFTAPSPGGDPWTSGDQTG